MEAEHKYANDDVEIVGVAYQDSRANALRYVRRMGGDWASVMDPGSRVAIEYGVYGVPETFFIDRDGVIAFKQIGPVDRRILDEWIPRLLAQPDDSSSAFADSLRRVGRSAEYQRWP